MASVITRMVGRLASSSSGSLLVILGIQLFGAVLPALLVFLASGKGPLRTIGEWINFRAGTDSWYPIDQAVDYAASHSSGTGLYVETYFNTAHQFIYSPLSVVLFQGLKLLGLDFGSPAVANLVSWFVPPLIAVVLLLLIRQLAPPPTGQGEAKQYRVLAPLVAVLGVIFFYPIMQGYTIGQIQTWLTALMALSILLWLGGYPFTAGLLLGLAAVVKPHLAVIGLWALVRGEWRALAGIVVAGGGLLLVSLATLGWQVQFEYLDLLQYLSRRGESFYASHSVESMLYRLIGNGNNLRWDGTHTQVVFVPWVHHLATAASAFFILTALVARRPISRPEALIDFCIVLLSIIVASPVAYEHHYGIQAAILLCLGLLSLRHGKWKWGYVAGTAIAYTCTAHYWALLDRTAGTAFNFVQSYRLWGALVTLAALHVLRREVRRSTLAAGHRPVALDPATPAVA